MNYDDVYCIFEEAFVKITNQLVHISLESDSTPCSLSGKVYTGVIHTRGPFEAGISCCMEESLYQAVLNGMTNGKEVSSRETVLYTTEYFNIVCGNAISRINNKIKAPSRLHVPLVVEDGTDVQLLDSAESEKVLYFKSNNGVMKVNIACILLQEG